MLFQQPRGPMYCKKTWASNIINILLFFITAIKRTQPAMGPY